MSFGGSWLEGDRTDINNWQNSLGSFNVDSKRIPKMMYDVMSNRGTCVATISGPSASPSKEVSFVCVGCALLLSISLDS